MLELDMKFEILILIATKGAVGTAERFLSRVYHVVPPKFGTPGTEFVTNRALNSSSARSQRL